VEEAPTLNQDAGIGLLRRTPSAPDKPCQAAVSPAAPALSTLSHVDQEDALSSHAALGSPRAPEHSIAGAVWTAVAPGHRQAVQPSRAGQPAAR
jgi:hypothetical protein